MCQNWNEQLGNLLVAEQSTVDGLVTAEGVSADTAKQLDASYVATEQALFAFKNGDDVTLIQSSLSLVLTETEALAPILPPQAVPIITVVIAGVKGGIALFESNTKTAEPEEQKQMMAKAMVETETSVPGFKLSHFELLRATVDSHVAAKHYKAELNKAVEAAGPKYAHLKQ